MDRLTKFWRGSYILSPKAIKEGYDKYSVYSRLAYYENLEEQGKLIILPKIGDIVYFVDRDYNECKNCTDCVNDRKCVYIIIEKIYDNYMRGCIGDNCFITREEAENRLREMSEL